MAQTFGIAPEELQVQAGEHAEGESPLETAWTFWYDKKTSDKKESEQYMEALKQLGTFNTIEGFYRHYSFLLRPSELPRDHNVYLFRKSYKPMWEEFPEGGCWIIRIKRKASQNYVNHMWENLLMACIGEAFEMPDVVGCVLSTRLKDDVLSVWNLSNRGTSARFRIGERLKEILDLNMTALIQYKDHMQSLQDFSTYRNAKNYMFAPSPAVTPLQGTLDTPVHSYQGNPPEQDLDSSMLPPAAMDDMLPPAAVDSEGFGGDMPGWADIGKLGEQATASGAATGAGSSSTVGKSPALSCSAAPWFPPKAEASAPAAAVAAPSPQGPTSAVAPKASAAAVPKAAAATLAAPAATAPKSWAAIAAKQPAAAAGPKSPTKSPTAAAVAAAAAAAKGGGATVAAARPKPKP